MTGATGERVKVRAHKVQPEAFAVDELGSAGVPEANTNAEAAGGSEEGTTVVRCATLKAFLISMAVFGLFHPMRFRNVGAKWWPALTAYSLGCLTFLAANSIHQSATMFQAGDATMQTNPTGFLLKVCSYGWQLSVLLAAAVLFAKNCAKDRGFARYYGELNVVVGKFEAAGMRIDSAAGRRATALCLAAGWALVLSNTAYAVQYTLSSLKGPDRSMLRWRADGGTTENEYQAMAYVQVVSAVYGAGAMVFPVIYVLIICMQMCTLWSCFNAELDRATASHPEKVLPRIGDYRRLYSEVCDVVSSANDCVEHLVGVQMCSSFAITMIQAYLIATNGASDDWPSLRVGIAIWLSSGLAVMATEFGAGCMVIDKARKSEEYLERIPYTRGSEVDCEHLAQLQLFMNQIKRDRGFEIFGIYPIEREALLPMIGTWITYLLILVQAPSNASAVMTFAGAAANSTTNMSSLQPV